VVAFPVLVGALALSRRGLSRALSTRPMVHGGRISFSLYLVHVPIFEIFWTMMQWHGRMGPGTVLGEAMVPLVPLFALVVAHLSYRYLEEAGRLWLRPRGPGRWSRRGSAAGRTVVAAPRSPEPELRMAEWTSAGPELAARS
jgi:peptidoglycan/LPS O-acetylase OafA/YrhL